MAKVKSIKKVGQNVPQKCIKIEDPRGLFVLENGLVTHNSSDFVMELYNKGKSRVESRMHGNYLGRALHHDEKIKTPNGPVPIRYLHEGDLVLTPRGTYSKIDCVPFYQEAQEYKIVLEDGRSIRCNKDHWWPCYKKDSEERKLLTTLELEVGDFLLSMEGVPLIPIKEIIKTEFTSQKCIHLDDGIGEFVLENNIITHNCILDSSPNNLDNAIDDYIVNEAPKDPSNMIVSGSMWEWNPEEYKHEFDNNEIFKVYVGGKGNPPRVLEENDSLLLDKNLDKSKIIDVPNSMKQYFMDDVVEALKDRAGIPSGSADGLITNYDLIERMFNNSLKNLYLSISASSMESPSNLIWDQIKDTFFRNKGGKYEFYYKPHIPRCISIDQSYMTDITSIAMSHAERYKDTGDTIYVVDFTIPILPKGGEKVNLDAITCFIEDLIDKGNLDIEHVSFDHFESEVAVQRLERRKKDHFVEKLSVDTSTGPYLNMISLINTNRLAVGKNIFLKNNLKCLHTVRSKKSGKTKIDHDNSRAQVTEGDSSWEKSQLGYFGKDVSDSVCASVELCSKYFLVPQDNWEGGPRVEELSNIKEREEARKNTLLLLRKMGLG